MALKRLFPISKPLSQRRTLSSLRFYGSDASAPLDFHEQNGYVHTGWVKDREET